jgi:hypothetical protein
MVAALKADPLGCYRANNLKPLRWLAKSAAPAPPEEAHAS